MAKLNRLKAAQRAGQKCIFCGAPVGSSEHFWPDWIKENSRAVKHTEVNHEQFSVHSQTVSQSDVIVGAPIMKRHSGSAVSRKLPIVCVACNTGWMSRLEFRTKPTLLAMIDAAGPTDLSVLQQAGVSRWADVRVMVAETTDAASVVSSEHDRDWVRHYRTPAPHTQVWIGRNGGSRTDTASLRHRSAGVTPVDSDGLLGEDVLVRADVLTIGHLAIYVTGSTRPAPTVRQAPPAAMTFAGKLVKTWPNTAASVHWPPDEMLTDDDLDELTNVLFTNL
jgi:hypothetical protein